jgi:hypothetical protein
MSNAGGPHTLRARSLDAPPRLAVRVGGHRPRESRPAPPTRGSSALCPPTPALPFGRILWVWLSCVWVGWRSSLAIVQPATVLAWHRRGFQLYWRWKSRAKPVGRPKLDPEVRHLIRRMARENPTWGRRRIQAELALLGYDVAELTVAKYMRSEPRLGLRRLGAPFWPRMPGRSSPWTSSSCRPWPSASCPSSSCSATTAANSSMSTSRITPRQAGPPGRSSRHSRTIRFPGSRSVIETWSTARSSRGESRYLGTGCGPWSWASDTTDTQRGPPWLRAESPRSGFQRTEAHAPTGDVNVAGTARRQELTPLADRSDDGGRQPWASRRSVLRQGAPPVVAPGCPSPGRGGSWSPRTRVILPRHLERHTLLPKRTRRRA